MRRDAAATGGQSCSESRSRSRRRQAGSTLPEGKVVSRSPAAESQAQEEGEAEEEGEILEGGEDEDEEDEEAEEARARRRPPDHGVDTIKITDDDAAFILGKGGKTKMKIARVSCAEIELFERDLILEIRGSEKQRRHGMKYARCVMAQRTGPVRVDDADVEDDCTVLHVPQDAVGFVTGKGGNFLRTIEDEWCVIMFFAEYEGAAKAERKDTERLTIFGERRGRRGAQLAVMRTVETKAPGYYTDETKASNELYDQEWPGEDWGTSVSQLHGDEISYAYGKRGMTKNKLANASGCIIQYVGDTVFLSGTALQRQRAEEYMKWLFRQLEGPVFVDATGRSDCTLVDVPVDCVGYVTGNRRETLGRMEEEWGTLMFFMERREEQTKAGTETLAIFGTRRARRGAELKVMSSVEMKNPGYFTKDLRDKRSERNGFDTEHIILQDDDLAYALGRDRGLSLLMSGPLLHGSMPAVFGPPAKPLDWVDSAADDEAAPDHDDAGGGRGLPEERLEFDGACVSVVQGCGSVVGTGCVVSAGVRDLVAHVASRCGPLAGRRALELGSGVGAAGIALAALGARVVLTDVPQNPRPELRASAATVRASGLFGDLLAVLEHNVGRNAGAIAARGGSAEVLELRWGDRGQLRRARGAGPFDLLLACNATYDVRAYGALAESLGALCGAGTRVFLANTSNLGDMPLLLAAAEAAGLRCEGRAQEGETLLLELRLAAPGCGGAPGAEGGGGAQAAAPRTASPA